MKITCPKCHASYRVDLPDPGEAGIDVQCGKCLHVFLFTSDTEKPGSGIQRDTSVKTQDSGVSKSPSSEPILPPQKDEEQEVFSSEKEPLPSQKEASASAEQAPEASEELELEPILDDPEPIEIVVEDDTPEESLEEVALEDIWDQAVREGARTMGKSKEKPPTPSAEEPKIEVTGKEATEESPPPAAKKSKLPSLEERQREIDQMIADHQAQQKEPLEEPPADETPEAPAAQEVTSQDKSQEKVDLEEQVVVDDEEEALPDWEQAFVDQSKVEEGWKKAQEQDRIHEEQQLSDALGKKALPGESADISETVPPEDKQNLVDEIFAEAKSQEEIDLEEQVVIDENEAMPSWEEAFADQSDVESSWGKAQEKDRIHEEQQLADALGEEYAPSEASAEEPPAIAAQEDKQSLVDQLFHEVRSQKAAVEPPAAITQDEPLEAPEAPTSETQETQVGEHTIPGEIDLMTDLDDLNMKQLVTQAFKEESESQEKANQSVPEDTTAEDETVQEPELTMESMVENLQEEPPPAEPIAELEMESASELTLESTEESPETVEVAAEEDKPELTMASMVENLQEEESVEATAQEESEIESISDLTLESAEVEPEPVEIAAEENGPELTMASMVENLQEEEPVEATAQEESEIESISELTLESAEQESELVMESHEETAEEELDPIEAVLQEEPEIEELTLESAEEEPQPVMEPHEETAASEEAQPALHQESILDEEDEEIWNDLLLKHGEEAQAEEEQPVEAEAPVTLTEEKTPAEAADAPVAHIEEEDEEPFKENDFWDQVLEKDSQESQIAETEPQPVTSAPVAGTAERETLTDEELWKQAFPGEDELEPAASEYSGEEEETLQSEPAPLVIEANVTPGDESEDSLKYDEAAYADYDDDDDFEFERRKRKLGPFVIPHGRRGDLVIGGAMVAFLLLAGSIYFTLQTFAPGELTDIQTAETEVPEGLTPREVPLDELAGLTPKPEKVPTVMDTPGDKGKATLSDPAKILEAAPEEKGILKDLAESQILKDTGETQTAKIDQSALQGLTGHSITLSTIMPVAYNPTDIRVLSFSVEIQLSDAQSAKRVRESMPFYEGVMNQTVEDFLRRKFYNDILYVKEKLQKRLQTAMNRSLKNGRVRKAKFTDFAIQ